MEKKITKRQVLEYMIETYSNDKMVVDYANHEIELLDNKKVARTLSKTQIANQELKGVIVDTLTNLARKVTIKELQNANEDLANLSNQKISALLSQLRNEGAIQREEIKKVAYFFI